MTTLAQHRWHNIAGARFHLASSIQRVPPAVAQKQPEAAVRRVESSFPAADVRREGQVAARFDHIGIKVRENSARFPPEKIWPSFAPTSCRFFPS
jgi:hypothetical protein